MRLFVCINLEPHVLDQVRNIQQQLCSWAGWRCAPAQHLHLTLKFLGKTQSTDVDRIKQALQRIAFKPFELKIAEPGRFGSRKKPRVIWLGVKPQAQLAKLAQQIEQALAPFATAEEKPSRFYAHITLGRVKEIYRPDTIEKHISGISAPNLKIHVGHFSLMHSILGAKAEYEILENFPADK